MDSNQAVVGGDCEKSGVEEVSKDKSRTVTEDLPIECIKDVSPSIDDEDLVLNEIGSSKDFGGTIDEDELLKDTDVDKTIVTESSESLNMPESDNNLRFNVDSTDDNCKQSAESKTVSSVTATSLSDEIPDSSNENKDKKHTDVLNINCKEKATSEAETVVTSSSTDVEKVTISEMNENSIDKPDEIKNSSLDTKNKSGKNTTISGEDQRLNIDDDSLRKINTVSNSEFINKRDSYDETKFLHVDQDNSRPEDSFEEASGEDPFAQTSDVAMDTSENSLKESKLDESHISKEVNDTSCAEVNESEVALVNEGNKSDDANKGDDELKSGTEEGNQSKAADESKTGNEEKNEPVDKIKGIDKDEKEEMLENKNAKSNDEAMDIHETTSDSTKNCESNKDIADVNKPNKCSENVSSQNEVSKPVENKCNEGNNENTDKTLENNGMQVNTTIQPTNTLQTETSESNETGKIQPQSQKSVKRNKRKKMSDDSDSDIDIEELENISHVPKRTPKRDAAKRAETQMKVLSQIDKEIKNRLNEDCGISAANVSKPDHPVSVATGTQSEEVTSDDGPQPCSTCKKVVERPIPISSFGNKKKYFCNNDCVVAFRDGVSKGQEGGEIIPPSTVISQLKSADIQPIDRTGFVRKCSKCQKVVNGDDEKTLSWETMDFCNEDCLGKYQQELGSHCANCKGNVQQTSLGKYCVRFGYEVKQFCCSTCLEEFKKGLKVCSFCQKDISSGAEGFLAPVGDKGTFKDFCTPACMEKYEQMSSNQSPPPQMHECAVCNVDKLVEIEVSFDNKVNKLCSDICFSAYKFANQLSVDRCDMCKKYFDKDAVGEKFNIFYEGVAHNFCCKTCMNVYILAKRKIVPCNWCKVKKYNFDMIKRVQSNGLVLMMCSLNCLTLYQVSVNAVSSKRIKCDMCNSVAQAQYHLTMSDATIRNFCTYPCVMNFQQQYSKSPITLPGNDGPPIPTGAPKRVVPKSDIGVTSPVISSVTSLANGQPASGSSTSTKPSGKLNLVARLCEPTVTRNKFTQTRPIMSTKSVSCRPHSNSVEVQTDESVGKVIIPVPIPIFVPCPMAMYSMPFPTPVPFPLPIPVPVFLPTTRNSIKGIMKELKRIREKVPEDPFEAELLMMAEMVAEDKAKDNTSSDSEAEAEAGDAGAEVDNDNDNDAAPSAPNSDGEAGVDEEGKGESGVEAGGEGEYTAEPDAAENSNTFGDDIMQMALKMATELTTPAAGDDLETQQMEGSGEGTSSDTPKRERETRGRKRPAPATKIPATSINSSEPKKKKSHQNAETTPSATVDEPKPDANMKLKFTLGVNAWKSWVTQKNAEIEKLNLTASKKLKPFKTDMLQLTVDELNYSLCLFIKEVKKPNGTSYAPDTIYYLCLGIQQYLFESGRIDNIFTDPYFETFTDTLNEVARKFSELYNDHHYIVTRVEEEHLWESKQLGAHSPHVLLSTLMFFNTKHFNLTSVDEHLLLSFSHIMKHWKRNQNQAGASSAGSAGGRAPGSRNVLLRFYPPQSLIDDPKLKKKRVYEQQENEENPLRCPVKLYEFYLSKCPESVKSRSDVFYLQPERSCVPDSPVWYSTMALQREPLEKMLNRVKMVKEINIALLVT